MQLYNSKNTFQNRAILKVIFGIMDMYVFMVETVSSKIYFWNLIFIYDYYYDYFIFILLIPKRLWWTRKPLDMDIISPSVS